MKALKYFGLTVAVCLAFGAGMGRTVAETGDFCGRGHGAATTADPTSPDYRKYAPDREVDILHLTLDVTPDFDRRSIAASARLSFRPIAKPLGELRLDAVGLRIETVESTHAIRAWHLEGESLLVTFEEPIPAGVDTEVEVRYSAEPKEGLYFRNPAMGWKEGDTQLWTQGEPEMHRHWFPSHDYPNEKFTSEVICHVPEGMTALSNGRLVSQSRDPESGLVSFHWLQDKPHVNYLISLVAGYFFKLEDRYGDIPLAIYVPPSEAEQAANSFRDTRDIMAFYEEEIGEPYPWDKYYNVCVLGFMWGGMENTSITTLTTRTLFTEATENLQSSMSLDAHEMAHQWFGDLVTCKDWSHLWLNEGFATYYQLLYTRHKLGQNDFLLGLYHNAENIFSHKNDRTPVVYRGFDDPVDQFNFRVYPKGGWVLHMLRSRFGEPLFRECIRTYLERHQFDTAVTEDLNAVFEEKTGRSLDRFFDQWVYYSGYPELQASYSWDESTRLAKIRIEQIQEINEAISLFQFQLPVRFYLPDGKTHTESLAVRERREDFYVKLPKAPEIVRLDPELTVLAQIRFSPPDMMMAKQLENPDDMMGRLLAVKHYADQSTDSAVDRLRRTLQEDAFYAVREEAARGLARIRTDAALDALTASRHQPDARVRREVVRGIGRFFNDTALRTLRQVAQSESNPEIRSQAIRALGKYPARQVQSDLLNQLHQDSYKSRLASAAIAAMEDQDNPDYITPLRVYLEDQGEAFSGRDYATALETLGRLARYEDSKDVIREFIAGRTHHPDRTVQAGALRALGHLRDPRAVALLESFTTLPKDTPVAKAASQAVEEIRQVAKPPEELRRLRELVLELQKEVTDLTQQVSDLQMQVQKSREAENIPADAP